MNEEIGTAYLKYENRVNITVNEFRGKIYVHVREYRMDGDTGFWYPTKSGYALLGDEVDSVIELLSIASEKIAQYYRNNSDQLCFEFEEDTNEYQGMV